MQVLLKDLRLWVFASSVFVIGWLVIRWKWRKSVDRHSEIERLMEAARLEQEEAESYGGYVVEPVEKGFFVAQPVGGYVPFVAEKAEKEVGSSSPGRVLQYECEVCLSPTTTRCKQCKAVRYCSGKCQIIHWRQGHKDKCQSLAIHQNNIDAQVRFRNKEFNQTGIGSNSNGVEIRHTIKPVELFSEEQSSSYPNFHIPNGKNESEGIYNDSKGTDMTVDASDSSLLGESLSSVSSYQSVTTGGSLLHSKSYGSDNTFTSMESLLSREEPVQTTNPDNGIAVPNNQHEHRFLHTDEPAESSSTSFHTAGTEEQFVSVPSTPSSDFWEGTIESIRTKIEPFHASDANNLSSRSSSVSSLDGMKAHAEVFRSDINKIIKEDHPVTSFSKNSNEKSKGPVLSCPEPSNHATSNNIGSLTSYMASRVNKQSLPPKMSDKNTDHKKDALILVDRPKNNSKAVVDEAQLPTARTTKKVVLPPHSVENGRAHKAGADPLKDNSNAKNVTSGSSSSHGVVDKTKESGNIVRGSSESGNGIHERYKGLYEQFVKLYNWSKFDLRPCGLVNCGNSCYANAVLQCLSFTPPLTGYFLEGLHSRACDKTEWCFTCELEMLVRKAKGSYSPVSPARIISQMQRIGRHLGDGREEDAHEFLRYAIDAMQNVCLKEAGVKRPSSLDEKTTLIGLTFGGYLRSKIECMKCREVSVKNERMMDLTVEIGGDIGTLEEALRQFTHSEILDGENKYRCDRCKSYEKAKKKLRVAEAPNVLTIALKRFQSGRYGKLTKAVKFPEVLNLAPYMTGTSDSSPIYMLYGVVVHLDIMNAAFSGHYVCYIKNKQGTWFQADDSSVQSVEMEKVLSKGAYLLLYARLSPRAPRAIRSPRAPPEARKPPTMSSKDNSHPAESFQPSIANLNCQNSNDRFYHQDFENGRPSDFSSSIFSESGSHTTESSSNRGSTSTDENMDQIFQDLEGYWTSPSESDSSSQSSSPSPMHARHSLLADMDRYSSGSDGDDFHSVLCPDSKLARSINYRESRLGGGMKGVHPK